MTRSFRSRLPDPSGADGEASPAAPGEAPLGGTRAEAVRRLQMGGVGVVAVLLLIGLASMIEDRAQQTDSTAVAEAAATTAPSPSTAAPDPLAEAGVVPDMPASPTAGTTASAAPTVRAMPVPPPSKPDAR